MDVSDLVNLLIESESKKAAQDEAVSRLKVVLRVVGASVLVMGPMFLPMQHCTGPKRDLSAFNNIAETGAFLGPALVLLAVGLATLILSWLLPGDR